MVNVTIYGSTMDPMAIEKPTEIVLEAIKVVILHRHVNRRVLMLNYDDK